MYTEIYHDNILRGITLTASDSTVLHIPIAEGNADYQQYQSWLADGNVPEVKHYTTTPVADEPTAEERLAALELVVSMVFGEDDANV